MKKADDVNIPTRQQHPCQSYPLRNMLSYFFIDLLSTWRHLKILRRISLQEPDLRSGLGTSSTFLHLGQLLPGPSFCVLDDAYPRLCFP